MFAQTLNRPCIKKYKINKNTYSKTQIYLGNYGNLMCRPIRDYCDVLVNSIYCMCIPFILVASIVYDGSLILLSNNKWRSLIIFKSCLSITIIVHIFTKLNQILFSLLKFVISVTRNCILHINFTWTLIHTYISMNWISHMHLQI